MKSKKYTNKKSLSKTKKNVNRIEKALESLSKDKIQQICKVSANTFSRFEDEYEKSEAFIKKGMNTKSEVEQKLINMIEVGSRDPLRPQDDFYGLINNVWVKEAKLTKEQQYIVQIDDFRLVQYKVYTQLIEIIEDYVKNNRNNLSKQLNNFYASVNKGLNDERFNYYCKTYINELDELRKDKKNLWILGLLQQII
jgi:hypothetical protein